MLAKKSLLSSKTLGSQTALLTTRILTDTWTPISSSVSFTSSAKASHGGGGHLGDIFLSNRLRGGPGTFGVSSLKTGSLDVDPNRLRPVNPMTGGF
jgi:hypothetical protein